MTIPKNYSEDIDPNSLSTLRKRYLKKVIVKEGCWGWNGATRPGKWKYGQIALRRRNGKYTICAAQKASWLVHKGDIPLGLCVLHACDNPICSNPEHLFLGTHKDNSQDMLTKGREFRAYGEENASAILTDDQARAIFLSTEANSVISIRFGVSQTTVYLIRKRLRYGVATKGLKQPLYEKGFHGQKGDSNTRAALTNAQARLVFLSTGSNSSVGREFGISDTLVSQIRSRKRYAVATAHLVRSSA